MATPDESQNIQQRCQTMTYITGIDLDTKFDDIKTFLLPKGGKKIKLIQKTDQGEKIFTGSVMIDFDSIEEKITFDQQDLFFNQKELAKITNVVSLRSNQEEEINPGLHLLKIEAKRKLKRGEIRSIICPKRNSGPRISRQQHIFFMDITDECAYVHLERSIKAADRFNELQNDEQMKKIDSSGRILEEFTKVKGITIKMDDQVTVKTITDNCVSARVFDQLEKRREDIRERIINITGLKKGEIKNKKDKEKFRAGILEAIGENSEFVHWLHITKDGIAFIFLQEMASAESVIEDMEHNPVKISESDLLFSLIPPGALTGYDETARIINVVQNTIENGPQQIRKTSSESEEKMSEENKSPNKLDKKLALVFQPIDLTKVQKPAHKIPENGELTENEKAFLDDVPEKKIPDDVPTVMVQIQNMPSRLDGGRSKRPQKRKATAVVWESDYIITSEWRIDQHGSKTAKIEPQKSAYNCQAPEKTPANGPSKVSKLNGTLQTTAPAQLSQSISFIPKRNRTKPPPKVVARKSAPIPAEKSTPIDDLANEPSIEIGEEMTDHTDEKMVTDDKIETILKTDDESHIGTGDKMEIEAKEESTEDSLEIDESNKDIEMENSETTQGVETTKNAQQAAISTTEEKSEVQNELSSQEEDELLNDVEPKESDQTNTEAIKETTDDCHDEEISKEVKASENVINDDEKTAENPTSTIKNSENITEKDDEQDQLWENIVKVSIPEEAICKTLIRKQDLINKIGKLNYGGKMYYEKGETEAYLLLSVNANEAVTAMADNPVKIRKASSVKFSALNEADSEIALSKLNCT